MKEIYKMHNKYEYWLAGIAVLPGRKKIRLKTMFETAEALYYAGNKTIDTISFLTEREKEGLKESQRRSCQTLEREMEYCIQNHIQLTVWQEETYPKGLENIYNPPYGLFYRGRMPDKEQKAIGVVGARNCSSYGRSTAEQIGRRFAEAGIAVVSGMAAGIDGAAQWGALQAGGYTCAVLGCGIDVCYPAGNRELYEKIMEAGGLLSEYPPHTRPHAMHFPQRNRIISGLSDGIVVVEAREKSGSLITADFALEQGKEIYAVPGRISDALSHGTNRLIQQGSGIFLNVEDFLKEMHIFTKTGITSAEKQKLSLENLERLVYSCLDLTPKNLDELLTETGLELGVLMENLETLRKKGCVSEVYKNYYIRFESFI